MGRVFDDILEIGEFVIESEEEDVSDVKDIENEVFICVFNLYFLIIDLLKIVNSVVSFDYFYLMVIYVLFGFGSMLFYVVCVSVSKFENVFFSYNFIKV